MSLRAAVASSSRLPVSSSLASTTASSSRSYGRIPGYALDPLRPSQRQFKPRVYAPIYNPVVDNPPATPPTWSPLSQRCGLIGIKKGMTSIWDSNGKHVPVTIVQVSRTTTNRERTTELISRAQAHTSLPSVFSLRLHLSVVSLITSPTRPRDHLSTQLVPSTSTTPLPQPTRFLLRPHSSYVLGPPPPRSRSAKC